MYISPEKRIYEQYEIYTPNTRRMLTTTTTNTESETNTTKNKVEEEKNEETLYYIFFVLSQIGGFWYLLKIVFGGFLNIFIENIQAADFINSIKSLRHTDKPKMKSQNLEKVKNDVKDKEEEKHNGKKWLIE